MRAIHGAPDLTDLRQTTIKLAKTGAWDDASPEGHGCPAYSPPYPSVKVREGLKWHDAISGVGEMESLSSALRSHGCQKRSGRRIKPPNNACGQRSSSPQSYGLRGGAQARVENAANHDGKAVQKASAICGQKNPYHPNQ